MNFEHKLFHLPMGEIHRNWTKQDKGLFVIEYMHIYMHLYTYSVCLLGVINVLCS